MNSSKILNCIGTFVIFLILSIYFFHPIRLSDLNTDLGFHLLLGKIIIKTGHIPTTNLLSYTFPDYPFINTTWLSQVIFYLWHSTSGFNGLITLCILLAIASFSLIFITAARKFDLFTTIIISLIYLPVLSGRVQVRPEIFSFLFLSLFIVILYKYREKYTRWIFALIPIQFLWVNFHIYFFVGIALLLFFLIDALFSKKDALSSKKFLTLFFVAIAAGLATLCNPNFIKGAFYPFVVLNNYAFPVRENINFFSAISSFTNFTLFYFMISVAILWINLLISRKRMALVDFLLSAFFTFMAFFAIRDFPLFVFGTLISCVKATSYILRTIKIEYIKKKIILIKLIFLILICISITPSINWNIKNYGLGFGMIDNAQDAIAFIKNNKIKGPIYNNFDIGSYLDYQLYPKEKVFVDNRPEAYPEDFSRNIYFPIQKSQTLFEQASNKYNFNIVFIAHTDKITQQLLRGLVRSNNWKMVYLDSSIVIFLKNSTSNQYIINTYLINENNITISGLDINDKKKVAQLANFFSTIGWVNPLLDMNLRYLDLEPSNCQVLKNVAQLMQKQKSPDSVIYINKYLQLCKK